MAICLAKGSTVSFGSFVRLTMTRPFGAYCLCNAMRCGMVVRQGGHQVAQNSSRTILPRRPARVSGGVLIQ